MSCTDFSGARLEGQRLRGQRYAWIDDETRAELEALRTMPGEPLMGDKRRRAEEIYNRHAFAVTPMSMAMRFRWRLGGRISDVAGFLVRLSNALMERT